MRSDAPVDSSSSFLKHSSITCLSLSSYCFVPTRRESEYLVGNCASGHLAGIKIEIVDQDGEWKEAAEQLGIPVVESIRDADLTLIHNYKGIDTYLNSTDSELFVAILTRLDDEERKVAFEEIVEGKCIPEHLRRWRPKQSFECEEGLSIEWTLTYICPGKVRCDGVREIKSKDILKNGCLGCIRLDQFLDEVLFKIEKRSKFGA
ncbi:hypothetical protein ROZALSC1DRAFT_30198 [Rozella allomycis CSF55]|uniref:Uncharacterized protein n=1 Tax=Rozella allomycis (strain CSF55) TaxID=988480 RepID=A0A4P9YFK9_ROZAC|nr:hypothetical protein ROZALSC1DRAFT_30198 [Rozella allomycis CSF55]